MSSRRVTLDDVARQANDSLATADRVVNRRKGVRPKTVAQVERAISKLGYRVNVAAARLARNRNLRFAFLLPSTVNPFMTELAEQVTATAEWLAPQQAFIDVLHVDVFDPGALATALRTLSPAYDGVALVALDQQAVRAAIDEIVARGVHVVTLVSDAPSTQRACYVGIDNRAAGRTAATMMGRFLAGRSGKIGIIVGSLSLRDHAERLFGFVQVLSAEYPHLQPLPTCEGRDESDQNRAIAGEMLARQPELVGIYNAGAGNQGVAAALEASGRAWHVIWIGHELTSDARRWLLDGTADALINQDAGHEARSAARILLARCEGAPILAAQERIRIEIFVRDNLP